MDASAAMVYYALAMTKQQSKPRPAAASYNAVARAMAHLGKVGGRHPDRRKEANRKACRGPKVAA